MEKSAEIVAVLGVGIPCPHCRPHSFSQARLVEPLRTISQELQKAALPYSKNDETLQITTLQSTRPNRQSLTSEHSPTTLASSASILSQNPQSSATNNGTSRSAGHSSRTSSLGRIFPSRSSGPAAPVVHVSYAMFTDANFVLAYSSHRISCYDCELKLWSKGYSFVKIVMAAGSCARYAVISKEPTVSHLPYL